MDLKVYLLEQQWARFLLNLSSLLVKTFTTVYIQFGTRISSLFYLLFINLLFFLFSIVSMF